MEADEKLPSALITTTLLVWHGGLSTFERAAYLEGCNVLK